MVIVRLLPLFLFPLLLLSAQFPDAASLLERSARAVQRYPGYQYTLDVTSETIVAGQAVKSTSTVQVSTASNDRFRIETRSEMMGESTIVADGESIWTYKPALKQYTKKPAGADLQGLLDSLGVGGIPPGVGKQEKNAKVIRAETLEVDGQKHDCWVVEMKKEKSAPPGLSIAEISNYVSTTWIDKKLDIDLQMTMSFKIQDAPLPLAAEMRLKFAKRSLRLNESLPDSLFAFTPPPGSVDSSGNAAATSKLDTAVQAFVPGLRPVERVEAVRPESARIEGVQGFVRVLVVVDGRVVLPRRRLSPALPLCGKLRLTRCKNGGSVR